MYKKKKIDAVKKLFCFVVLYLVDHKIGNPNIWLSPRPFINSGT